MVNDSARKYRERINRKEHIFTFLRALTNDNHPVVCIEQKDVKSGGDILVIHHKRNACDIHTFFDTMYISTCLFIYRPNLKRQIAKIQSTYKGKKKST